MSNSRNEDVMMQVRDRMRSMNQEDYEYYVSTRGYSGNGSGKASEKRMGRSRSRSGSESVVYEEGQCGGGSSDRVRSRSPGRRYNEITRKEDLLDAELGHRGRRRSTTPPLQQRETYVPALRVSSQMRSSCFTDKCRYGDPMLEAGLNEYSAVHGNKMVVSDDFDVVGESVEDPRMVRVRQDIQHVSSYGENSRHFHSGSTDIIVDKRARCENYLSMERALNMGKYDEDRLPLYSRGTSYPVSSKSQANIYASTSPTFRDGEHISSCCTRPDEICVGKSIISKQSVYDAYKGYPSLYTLLGHQDNARDSSKQLKSTHDSIHHLNYHYPTARNREKGELGYLSDTEFRNTHGGFLQADNRQRAAPRTDEEVSDFSHDEEYEALYKHAHIDCYNPYVHTNLSKEKQGNHRSDCSLRDVRFSRHASIDRDIHSDPHSCLSHPESLLHGCNDHDFKDPYSITSSNYDHRCMAAGTFVDNKRIQEHKIHFTNATEELIYNADISEDRFWSSAHKEQDGEQYYNTTRTASSTEPRDQYFDSGIYNPIIHSEIKQYDDHLDFPSLGREHCNEIVRYRYSQRKSIDSIYDSIYDVNAKTEYDIVVPDANKQRRLEIDHNLRGAPGGILEGNSVTYNISGVLDSGGRISHERCNSHSSRYLPDRREILPEGEMDRHLSKTTGADHTRQTKSRSIFDRLGSPQGSNDRFSKRRMEISHKQEFSDIKDYRKSNHLTLDGLLHSSRGSSRYKQSSYSSAAECHMKPTGDMDTLSEMDPVSHNKDGDFKKSIQKAFELIYLKINENLATRMRYTSQGKAGTLFCVVCKRSNSKEFRVSQDLAAHSLTCQKSGLRGPHLGLFKAICVTMGWNSDIDRQSGMWTPQILSEEKALAQKEDLICWPPVVIIHNVSLIRKNHTAHEVMTAEELEAFFRSKGFISGGVKVCFGNSMDNHIVVIKFLGTFTGFKDAEKFHEYFAESKHGRVEYWKQACIYGKGSQSGLRNENMEMPDLYGYMAIAEDWGKLDTESKKRCRLKSKQEILDFSAEPILHGRS